MIRLGAMPLALVTIMACTVANATERVDFAGDGLTLRDPIRPLGAGAVSGGGRAARW